MLQIWAVFRIQCSRYVAVAVAVAMTVAVALAMVVAVILAVGALMWWRVGEMVGLLSGMWVNRVGWCVGCWVCVGGGVVAGVGVSAVMGLVQVWVWTWSV
jgi:hypothetical protein